MLALSPLVLVNNKAAFQSDPRGICFFFKYQFSLLILKLLLSTFSSKREGEKKGKGALLFSSIPSGFRDIKE